MSARLISRRTEETESTTPWLITFCDLMLLLITVFVMKLAMSSLENERVARGLGMPLEARVEQQRASMQVAKELRRVLSAELGAATVEQGAHPMLRFPDEITLTVLERGVRLSIGGGRFLPGSRDLSPQTREVLAKLTSILSAQDALVKVEGHTDSTPIATAQFASNWELSTARAIAVVEVLRERGLEGKRISAVGYSDTRPVASNATEEGRAANRRVEILLEPPVRS